MSTPEFTIRVDTRERGKIIKSLEAIEGLNLAFEEMEVGDYILPNGVAIERKSSTDLILSVVDKSIWGKVAKLREQYAKVIYIIEGDLYTARFHQQPMDIHRALAHMVIAHDVAVLPSPDAENSAMMVYLLALAALEQPPGA